MTQTPEQIAALVSDEEIDALVDLGWDWHSAYRHLQANAHSVAVRAILEKNNERG